MVRGLAGVLIASLVLGGTLGCQTTGRSIEMPEAQPPLAELVVPPRFLTPRSQRYRVAVRSFVDQTGQAGAFSDAAGEVLLTALHARDRFSIYDIRQEAGQPGPAIATAVSAAGADVADLVEIVDPSERAAGDDYRALRGVVDGVIESSITAVTLDGKGSGHFEVDYRIVDPYSRMVVTSGSARLGVRRGALVRKDFAKLAGSMSRSFIDPDVMAQHQVGVSEVSLDQTDVKLILDGGSEKQVKRGFVGFVVEQDPHTHVDRYIAKFVVVNVFPQAAVGVVVEHCNSVGRCAEGRGIVPIEQAQNVHLGSRVRFK
jgi:hypothetical protein